jgi:type II secretory ATPase GspE/PulE/Tfp pilus assembly ATPase PilB-like protein
MPKKEVTREEPRKELDIEVALAATGYISPEDLDAAKKEAKRLNASLQDILVGKGYLTRDLLGKAIGEYLKVPFADLKGRLTATEEAKALDEETAKRYSVVGAGFGKKGELMFASPFPAEKGLLPALKKLFPKKNLIIAYAFPEDVQKALVAYKAPLATRFAKILEEGGYAPEILAQIFEDAVSYNASDIHFEPMETEVRIRFRVDGIMREAGRVPKERYENMLNRLKVQAQLRIDQHLGAQDGAIRAGVGDRTVDMRISIVPTLEGEKVVLRLLAQYVKGFSTADLGLSEGDALRVEAASKKPFGMILVVGPTGSGKTTSLYVLLRSLHRPEINITTIEDPVEYRIPGINQIQVNEQTNLTFAEGLRSIVRQDPNVILVGEIRDEETADIAVNAALTGHLLLSTFHANDASTAVPRLIEMGIEPFLLASTLELIVAQRLVRKICTSCRYSKTVGPEELAALPESVKPYFANTTTLYAGKGCSVCTNTGYSGRTGVFELLSLSRELRDLVLKNPSSQEIWTLARSQGAKSMFDDGVEKVQNGVTTIEELLRVAVPPELKSIGTKEAV